MLYMVIERFRNRDPKPVYARFRERGRLAPAGLTYVNSWVTEDLGLCYQVMECLVEFEGIPVVTSAEAGARA